MMGSRTGGVCCGVRAGRIELFRICMKRKYLVSRLALFCETYFATTVLRVWQAALQAIRESPFNLVVFGGWLDPSPAIVQRFRSTLICSARRFHGRLPTGTDCRFPDS